MIEVEDLFYELKIRNGTQGYGGVEELKEGEEAWVFFPITLKSEDGVEIGKLTDFLYKNIRDMKNLLTAVSDDEDFLTKHHDNSGHIIEVKEYSENKVKLDFDPGKEAWIQKSELESTLEEILDLLKILIEGVNPEVMSEIEEEL